MQIHLSKPDRDRYGLPDGLLDVDLSLLMQDEAEALDEYGIDPDAWEQFINGGDVKVWRVVVWLALARNGVQVALAEVKFNRRGTRWLAESPGKEPPGEDQPASETSDAPTPPPSSPGSPD